MTWEELRPKLVIDLVWFPDPPAHKGEKDRSAWVASVRLQTEEERCCAPVAIEPEPEFTVEDEDPEWAVRLAIQKAKEVWCGDQHSAR